MNKRVYISADYSANDGDRTVVEVLKKWSSDSLHKIEFVDMATVTSGSVTANPDCRPCDLKAEFNRQINASSSVIFVVGDKTASRAAGSNCSRNNLPPQLCPCTPYKQNTNGSKYCKVFATRPVGPDEDYGNINTISYLQHEFEQAKKKQKNIIIVYNSLYNESSWLPSYMEGYKNQAFPFWTRDAMSNKVGNYPLIKEALGYA